MPTQRRFDLNTLVTVISAVLVFGFLILIHELGHFFAARIFKVKVNEFSIGMGPKLFSVTSKKSGTRYAISALPIGGYVAMAGEDDECDDPDSFSEKPAWQRLIITVAGPLVNIVFGFIAMIIFTAVTGSIGSTVIHSFIPTEGAEVSSADSGLMPNDEIIEIDGKRVRSADELSYEVMRRATEPIDVLVIRNGEELLLKDVVFPTVSEQGQVFGILDFAVWGKKKTFGTVMSYSLEKSVMMVRMVYESLYDLFTGRYSFAAVSGPVGISQTIGEAARAGFSTVLYITALISINLGVMNLLPLPALDGGRTLTTLAEIVTRKRMPKKVEAAINGAGLILLLALSAVVLVKDVIQLII